jgi:hypothetical protein
MVAAPYILATGKPVIAMGGFIGSDPAPTLAGFKQLVAGGQVHYVLVGGGITGGAAPGDFGGGLPKGFPGGGEVGASGSKQPGVPFDIAGQAGGKSTRGVSVGTTASSVDKWVVQHGRKVPSSSYHGGNAAGTLYYVPPESVKQ